LKSRTLERQRGAAPTAKPSKSLFRKLAQWYHPSGVTMSQEGRRVAKGAPHAGRPRSAVPVREQTELTFEE